MTTILNLGCGTKTSPRTINIDWSIYLRMKRNPVARRVAPLVLSGVRREQFLALDDNFVIHDLRKGIPAEDSTVDAVYHSHVLEHLDRDAVPGFFAEIRRVLRPGGVHRVVVPDLERYAREYLSSLEKGAEDPAQRRAHDATVSQMILQMVRRDASGTSRQSSPLQRWAENLFLGDARKRGETHMWMWDRVNLTCALEEAGFRDAQILDFQTSRIPEWNDLGLDRRTDGSEYKPESLYVETLR
jgi:SAM-dependent methyltransferase